MGLFSRKREKQSPEPLPPLEFAVIGNEKFESIHGFIQPMDEAMITHVVFSADRDTGATDMARGARDVAVAALGDYFRLHDSWELSHGETVYGMWYPMIGMLPMCGGVGISEYFDADLLASGRFGEMEKRLRRSVVAPYEYAQVETAFGPDGNTHIGLEVSTNLSDVFLRLRVVAREAF